MRGKVISMIFQEPMSAFSMVYTIGNQITEVIRLHQRCSAQEARERAIEILRRVGMPKPEQTIDAYPFALSGGMRQRAMIAMALACRPSLLIADEPTTVVDDPKIYQQTIVRNRIRNVPTWTTGEWYPSLPISWFINE